MKNFLYYGHRYLLLHIYRYVGLLGGISYKPYGSYYWTSLLNSSKNLYIGLFVVPNCYTRPSNPTLGSLLIYRYQFLKPSLPSYVKRVNSLYFYDLLPSKLLSPVYCFLPSNLKRLYQFCMILNPMFPMKSGLVPSYYTPLCPFGPIPDILSRNPHRIYLPNTLYTLFNFPPFLLFISSSTLTSSSTLNKLLSFCKTF